MKMKAKDDKIWPLPGPKGINKNMSLFANVPAWIRENPDHLKTQEMCFEAVRIEPLSLAFVPGHFKTQEMCNEVVLREPYSLLFVPDHLKTQAWNEIIRAMPETLEYVPDDFETQETCDKIVENEPHSLKFVPDHFKTQEIRNKAARDDPYSIQYVLV